MSKIIEVKEITKIYKMGEYKICALDGASLTINEGDFLSITGPSGSGKTTLLNLLGLIDKPSDGLILLEGRETTELNERELDNIRLKKIGFVFQSFNLIPTLTSLENVELPMELNKIPRDERKEKAVELLRLVGLKERLNHRPYQLSMGEQQRVGIARALSNDPVIILADEPTGNLDSKTAEEIVDIFLRLNENRKTIVVVTHNLSVANKSKKILNLRDGRIAE